MNADPRLETFLDQATTGLKADRELQLDVRHELASHLDAAQEEARAGGQPDPEAAALKQMGAATEIAGDLAAANRRRMTVRARIRRTISALLLPAAVLVAAWTAWQIWEDVAPMAMCVGKEPESFAYAKTPRGIASSLSPDQRLVLFGDPTRKDPAAQQRAIWEAHPENRVYLHNYLSHNHQVWDESHSEASLAQTKSILAQAATLDPGNARVDYLLAGSLLKNAAKVETTQDAVSKKNVPSKLLIQDRARLDEAMNALRQGLQKPEYRRYAKEMTAERLATLGPPDSFAGNLYRIGIAASTILPDLSNLRELSRVSVLYAGILIEEGRTAEAEALLDAEPRLTLQLARDSFTLIDVLVVHGLLEQNLKLAPPMWEKLGHPERAEALRRDLTRLVAPGRDWRAKRKTGKPPNEDQFMQHGSRFATMLMPVLGEFPDPQELAPGRELEYVLVERGLSACLILLFTGALFAAGLVALRWRFSRGGASAPLLLVPGPAAAARIVLYGALLPVLGYWLFTRYLPVAGREWNILNNLARLCLQLMMVAGLVVGLTVRLTTAAVRARCQALGVEMPDERLYKYIHNRMLGIISVSGVLLVLPLSSQSFYFRAVPFAAAGLTGLCLLGGVTVFLRYLFGPQRFGLYYGTLARSLMPALAAVVIVIGTLAGPLLRLEERKLVREDTMMTVSPEGGFTRVECDLVQRLRQQILGVAESQGVKK